MTVGKVGTKDNVSDLGTKAIDPRPCGVFDVPRQSL